MHLTITRSRLPFAWLAPLLVASITGTVHAVSLHAQTVPLPTAVEIHAPIYPEMALKARILGTVSIRVLVKSDGTVNTVSVVTRAHPLLDQASEAAAQRWRFQPSAVSDNRYLTLTFSFRLDGEGTSFLLPAAVEIRAQPPVVVRSGSPL